MTTNIAKLIRDWRVAHGWTQGELADRINANGPHQISRYETQTNAPPFEVCEQIASAFSVPLIRFLAGPSGDQGEGSQEDGFARPLGIAPADLGLAPFAQGAITKVSGSPTQDATDPRGWRWPDETHISSYGTQWDGDIPANAVTMEPSDLHSSSIVPIHCGSLLIDVSLRRITRQGLVAVLFEGATAIHHGFRTGNGGLQMQRRTSPLEAKAHSGSIRPYQGYWLSAQESEWRLIGTVIRMSLSMPG